MWGLLLQLWIVRSTSRKDPSEKCSSQKTRLILCEESTSSASLNVEHERTLTDIPSSMQINAFRFPISLQTTRTCHRLNIKAPQIFTEYKQRKVFGRVVGRTSGSSGETIAPAVTSWKLFRRTFRIVASVSKSFRLVELTE